MVPKVILDPSQRDVLLNELIGSVNRKTKNGVVPNYSTEIGDQE